MPARIPTAPLFFWLAAQCLALVFAASRIPLSNGYPEPAERVTLELLLLTQIVASAFLFPVLLTNVSSTIVAIVASAPFIMLARILAAEANHTIVIAAGLYLALWIIALALVRAGIRTMHGQLVASAAAMLLAIGGPIIWYLHAEFALEESAINWRTHGVLGPVMGAWAVLQYPLMKRAWAFVFVCVLGGALSLALRRTMDRRKKAARPSANAI